MKLITDYLTHLDKENSSESQKKKRVIEKLYFEVIRKNNPFKKIQATEEAKIVRDIEKLKKLKISSELKTIEFESKLIGDSPFIQSVLNKKKTTPLSEIQKKIIQPHQYLAEVILMADLIKKEKNRNTFKFILAAIAGGITTLTSILKLL